MDMITRFGEPSSYDHCQFGTLCKKLKVHMKDYDIYVQVSNNESNPEWELVGTFNDLTEKTIEEEVLKVIPALRK